MMQSIATRAPRVTMRMLMAVMNATHDDDRDYDTLAGFILDDIGDIPSEGEKVVLVRRPTSFRTSGRLLLELSYRGTTGVYLPTARLARGRPFPCSTRGRPVATLKMLDCYLLLEATIIRHIKQIDHLCQMS